ncbi:hypothetical protein GCM10008090_29950 [Arenicella chitinivorans]|uniref:DUF3080 family protein n=1 Tax=Arenicella chitinivorans TaxID=1329800 RepID=A0A918RZP0_9GAMM|nr:DUF3080 family protein [Arenicella chitinivorans]GHA18378.1 hypothetical protein GCM10008090_29950 [Arenicella chitinivorans]
MHRRIFPLLLLVLLGCDRPIGEDYVIRLERVLDRDAPRIENHTLSFPAPRQLLGPESDTVLSVREFLSLRGCRLHTALAHRNSQMGKLASQSQRLFNDLEILATGPECIAQLNNKTLASKLSQFITLKQAQLPHQLAHALLHQDENRAFWRAHHETDLRVYAPAQKSIAYLTQFSREVLTGRTHFSEPERNLIERHLGELRFGRGGDALIESDQIVHALTRADSLIALRLAQPLCFNTQATPSARRFQTVISKVFIQQVQPLSIQLQQLDQALLDDYNQFEDLLLPFAALPYQQWAQQRRRRMQQRQQAPAQHVARVQQLFLQCGLTVGGSKT